MIRDMCDSIWRLVLCMQPVVIQTKKGGTRMDFMTSFAYWGMAALVIINGIIVVWMKVDIGDDGKGKGDSTKCQTGI